MTTHRALQVALVVWALVLPVVACTPALLSEQDVAVALSALFALGVFWIFFAPWLIGLVALGLGVYLTSPSRRR